MTGRVVDSQTLQPLWSANVYWKDANGIAYGDHTDTDGRFDLEVAQGEIVFVSFVGYSGKAIEASSGPVEVMLDPGYTLPEVVVEGDRPSSSGWGWLALLVGIGVASRWS